jgi:hypothetical protein
MKNNLEQNLPKIIKFTEEDYKKTDLIFGRYPHQRKLCDFTDLVQIGNENVFKKVTKLIPCDTREAELIFYQTNNREHYEGSSYIYGEFFDAWYAMKDGRFFRYWFSRWWNRGENRWDNDGHSSITSKPPELFMEEYNENKSVIIKEYNGDI